jgi:hypothetical protein
MMPSQDGCQSTMDGAVVGFNGAVNAALLLVVSCAFTCTGIEICTC